MVGENEPPSEGRLAGDGAELDWELLPDSSLLLHGVPLKQVCFLGQSLLSPDGQAWATLQSMTSHDSAQKFVFFRSSR